MCLAGLFAKLGTLHRHTFDIARLHVFPPHPLRAASRSGVPSIVTLFLPVPVRAESRQTTPRLCLCILLLLLLVLVLVEVAQK